MVTVLILLTIILRVFINVTIGSGTGAGPAVHGLNFVQAGTVIFSAITNLLATMVIGLFVW